MLIDSFYEASDSKSWNSEPDFEQYGDELAFYTEGTVLFEDENSSFHINIYLLEFIAELDMMLTRRLGQRFFKEHLSFQLSGESLVFSRDGSYLLVSMERQKKFVLYDWNKFIELFISIKNVLNKKFIDCYPRISKLIELKLLLG